MLLATPNQAATLSMLAADDRADLFGLATIYNSANAVVTTISITNIAGGLYGGSWTPTTEGYYTVRYEFFFDSGHTIGAGYEIQAEIVDVSAFRTNILRVLGLNHENAVVDLCVYDSDENLTSSRVRCYDSAANAVAARAASPAAYNTGLQFQYTLTATFSGGFLATHSISRVL